MARGPVPVTHACRADDHDDRSFAVTCSARTADWPGARATRLNCTSLRTACWMPAGRPGEGPTYTCGTPDPARGPVLVSRKLTSIPPLRDLSTCSPEYVNRV